MGERDDSDECDDLSDRDEVLRCCCVVELVESVDAVDLDERVEEVLGDSVSTDRVP
jgi:hypothetical protein